MDNDRRALYNSLRMHWQNNSDLEVEPWQVEDYRALSLETLFQRLNALGVKLDKNGFLAYAANVDSPEELSDTFTAHQEDNADTVDQIYLITFELWRRLLPENRSLSIFCDELDYQIDAFDHGKLTNLEPLEDVLGSLEQILDEYSDEGEDPRQIFGVISSCCANDVESFLYDFIALQIDNENYPYASELLDDFLPFVEDPKWFLFLRARLANATDGEEAEQISKQVLEMALESKDLDFHLEVLAFFAKSADENMFLKLALHTIPLMQVEEDVRDVLLACVDYFHFRDRDEDEGAVHQLLSKRAAIPLEQPFEAGDLHLQDLVELLKRVAKRRA
jgi:hypothetical protein